ncbi:hypothetical protein ACTXLW_00510 [Psychrobacter celer]|uniref:hypothetical protein n=1 Tax=Psychrobacter celer TaxID=306572 RepID=UPI003FD3BB19
MSNKTVSEREREIEVKREMINLLLTTSQFNFNKAEQVTVCAGKLTKFILESDPQQEPAGT